MTYHIRRATLADVDAIADAHRDSIHAIGARFYPADVVSAWGARVAGGLYANAMASGEVFFIAIDDGDGTVLGFSSHHVDEGEHRTAVYVKGAAARRGVGSALFRTAEAEARAAGAASIFVAASLAAEEFYRAHGFEEAGRGQHEIGSGRSMGCIFMRKTLHHDHRLRA
jgi:GNAT superfamily N-acetyltransferase